MRPCDVRALVHGILADWIRILVAFSQEFAGHANEWVVHRIELWIVDLIDVLVVITSRQVIQNSQNGEEDEQNEAYHVDGEASTRGARSTGRTDARTLGRLSRA